jgi:uncharacterized protein
MSAAIFYHLVSEHPYIDCPDGICSAWIAKRYMELKNIPYSLHPICYRHDDEWNLIKSPEDLGIVDDRSAIYFIDITLPKKIMEMFVSSGYKIICLDHHEDKFEILNIMSKSIRGFWDEKECGSTLAWKYFFPGEQMPWFLPHVKARDIGENGYYMGLNPKSEAISNAMSSRRKASQNPFDYFEALWDENPQKLISEGLPIIKKRDEDMTSYKRDWLASPKFVEILGEKIPFIDLRNYPHLQRHYSVVGAQMAIALDAAYVCVCVNDPLRLSLRAAENKPPCLPVAIKMGGGGHPRACGFSLKSPLIIE